MGEANFNLNATFQSSSEDEDELNSQLDYGCVLCGHLEYGGCDVKDIVQNSQHTYADVLQKLLGRSETESNSSNQQIRAGEALYYLQSQATKSLPTSKGTERGE